MGYEMNDDRTRVPKQTYARPGFTVQILGGRDWSFRHAGKGNAGFDEALAGELRGLGIREAYAPDPTRFNAAVIGHEALRQRVRVVDAALLRNPDYPAESMLVPRGGAFAISQGGCPIVVMEFNGKLSVSHAGRDSLFDRERVIGGKPAREYESVCFAALESLGVSGFDEAARARARVFGSISPCFFLHPLSGPHKRANEAMWEHFGKMWGFRPSGFGRPHALSLPHLIKRQLMSRGMPEESIDIGNPYLGPGMFDTGMENKENAAKRNLMIVKRH